MFYEYALIPDIFSPDLLYCDPLSETVVTQLLEGIAHNGMIANLHKDGFRTLIGKLVESIPDAHPDEGRKSPRNDLQSYLELLDNRNRFVRHPKGVSGDPTDASAWLNLALKSHLKQRFDGIVMCDTVYQSARMSAYREAAPLHQALRTPFWRGRQTDVTLEKRKGQFELALTPILRHAKAVTLIDPYIDPRKRRWFHIVDLLGKLVGKQAFSGPSSWGCRIHIHAGDPEKDRNPQSLKDRIALWRQELRNLPATFRVSVFLWSKDISGPDLHDRYIITNQCGITCPGGLDCYEDNDPSDEAKTTSTWSLMSQEATARHFGEYSENTGLYKLLNPNDLMAR